jgi:alpha-beta hydrolase superfamily lysophospholipase
LFSSQRFSHNLINQYIFCLDKPELFTLDGQVNHKIDFIDTYVPADVNLHFIGHSIGAKICVELVKRYRDTHNAAAYLLFPTLERMAQTPSGRKLWPILGPLRKVVVFAASLLHRLPESWLTPIVEWAMRKDKYLICKRFVFYFFLL